MNNEETSNRKYTLSEIKYALKAGASFVIGSGEDEKTISFFDYEGDLTSLGEACSEDEPDWIEKCVDMISQESFRILSVIET